MNSVKKKGKLIAFVKYQVHALLKSKLVEVEIMYYKMQNTKERLR